MGEFPVTITVTSIEGYPTANRNPIDKQQCINPSTTWQMFLKLNKIKLRAGTYRVVAGGKKSYSLDSPIKEVADNYVRKRKFSVKIEIDHTTKSSSRFPEDMFNDQYNDNDESSNSNSSTIDTEDDLSQMAGEEDGEVESRENSKLKNDAIRFLRENVPPRKFAQAKLEIQKLKQNRRRVLKWRDYSETSATILSTMLNIH